MMGMRVVLPSQLRELAGGRGSIELGTPAATVGAALEELRRGYPAVYDRIFTERHEIRPHVNVFVDHDDIRWTGGLETPIRDGCELVVIPSVSGG